MLSSHSPPAAARLLPTRLLLSEGPSMIWRAWQGWNAAPFVLGSRYYPKTLSCTWLCTGIPPAHLHQQPGGRYPGQRPGRGGGPAQRLGDHLLPVRGKPLQLGCWVLVPFPQTACVGGESHSDACAPGGCTQSKLQCSAAGHLCLHASCQPRRRQDCGCAGVTCCRHELLQARATGTLLPT